jgi:hypothetical protein
MSKKPETVTTRHPEDAIAEVKTFVNQLSEVQGEKFDALCKSLGMNEKGADWLFDYVYNCDEPVCFDEYLAKFGEEYRDCLSPDREP